MIFKTKGLVLSYIRYRDTSIIVRIYTEVFGVQSYIVNSIRSAKSKTGIALFQPLTLLDLEVYHKPSTDIQRIKELKVWQPFVSIPSDVKKQCMVLFLAELISKSIKQEGKLDGLFEMMTHSILKLDRTLQDYENMHLQFIIRFSELLGYEIDTYAIFEHYLEVHGIATVELKLLENRFATLLEDKDEFLRFSQAERKCLLDRLVDFLRLHHEGLSAIRSLEVLHSVYSD